MCWPPNNAHRQRVRALARRRRRRRRRQQQTNKQQQQQTARHLRGPAGRMARLCAYVLTLVKTSVVGRLETLLCTAQLLHHSSITLSGRAALDCRLRTTRLNPEYIDDTYHCRSPRRSTGEPPARPPARALQSGPIVEAPSRSGSPSPLIDSVTMALSSHVISQLPTSPDQFLGMSVLFFYFSF
ncbi:hypothetical protein JDV02_004509 [Purpureocillium takamizusanense]|uniref:Uncharacterized protein n=1 Tax=Purpureocillium takamizusanense TaxID=2060973 RepID=A0A9Q8VAX6_9HYPO|nr:uncharacterized protein JDV02_004509 [Purpureocillium takamizusanense]UNI18227.1 hypothetical protein JDV02_004509 [Purpureocillium takamizusanense]